MKAAVYNRYGPPDIVQIKDVERPVPKDNEVWIEVRTASVNQLDGQLNERQALHRSLTVRAAQTKDDTTRR